MFRLWVWVMVRDPVWIKVSVRLNRFGVGIGFGVGSRPLSVHVLRSTSQFLPYVNLRGVPIMLGLRFG